jgi:polar amino acid transport system permease protein
VAGYVQLFQGTPLLMQLFLAYFGLALLGINVSAWVAAAVWP